MAAMSTPAVCFPSLDEQASITVTATPETYITLVLPNFTGEAP